MHAIDNPGTFAHDATIVEDICELSKNLQSMHVQHCNRAANYVAHFLAREAISLGISQLFVDFVPFRLAFFCKDRWVGVLILLILF